MANLFDRAKQKGATASKSEKTEVNVKDAVLHTDTLRLIEINEQIATLAAEANILAGNVKTTGISEFEKLFNENGTYPGSFNIRINGAKKKNTVVDDAVFQFIPSDAYKTIDEARFKALQTEFGTDIAEEKTTYIMDAALIEKYGAHISDMIVKSKVIAEEDKPKLISAQVKWSIKKGTLPALLEKYKKFGLSKMITEILPTFSVKNLHKETPESINS